MSKGILCQHFALHISSASIYSYIFYSVSLNILTLLISIYDFLWVWVGCVDLIHLCWANGQKYTVVGNSDYCTSKYEIERKSQCYLAISFFPVVSICFVLGLPGRLLCTAILTELDSSRHDVTFYFYCLVSLLSAQINQTETSEMKEGRSGREEKHEEAETELHGFRLVNNVRLLMWMWDWNSNSKHLFTTSFLQPLPYLVMS